MNSVVLARYSESLDWITEIPDDFDVIIYNKGEKIESPDIVGRATRIIDRPNVGRESETYLHHMRTQVQGDNDFTVFSQGDPFTHSPDFIRLLQNWRDWKPVQALSWQWREDKNIPPAALLEDYQRSLGSRLRVRPERFSLTTWGAIDFVDPGANGMSLIFRILQGRLPDGINVATRFLQLCKLPHIAEEADKYSLGIFSYGAIFAVRNDRIATVPYEALEAMLQLSTAGVEAHGYLFERLWLHFFGQEFLLPKNQPSLI